VPEVLIPFAVFGSLVLVVGQLTRLFSDISLNRTIREALRSDPASVPLLADRLGERQPWADALIGWIFIAFAVGIVLVSLFEAGEDRRDMLQAAAVPLIVGVVVLAYVAWAKRELEEGGGIARATSPAARIPSRARKSPARAQRSEG